MISVLCVCVFGMLQNQNIAVTFNFFSFFFFFVCVDASSFVCIVMYTHVYVTMVKPEQVIALLSHRFQMEKKNTHTHNQLQQLINTYSPYIKQLWLESMDCRNSSVEQQKQQKKKRTHKRQNNTTQCDVSIIGNQSNTRTKGNSVRKTSGIFGVP